MFLQNSNDKMKKKHPILSDSEFEHPDTKKASIRINRNDALKKVKLFSPNRLNVVNQIDSSICENTSQSIPL